MFQLNASLRAALARGFIFITLLLVAGYTVLSARYFIAGMDNIMANNLLRAAKTVAKGKHTDTPTLFDDYVVTRDWQTQPQAIRDAVKQPPLDKQMHKYELGKLADGKKQLIFYMGARLKGKPYYVSYYIPT